MGVTITLSRYKIYLLIFALFNILLFVWSAGLFDSYFTKDIEIDENELPIILPYNDKVKVEPPEIELFPNSESPLWESYKAKNQEINDVNKDSPNTVSKQNDNNEKKIIIVEKPIENDESNIATLENKADPDLKEEISDNYKKKEIISSTDHAKLNNSIDKKQEEKSTANILKSQTEAANVLIKFYAVQFASLSDEQLLATEWKRLQKIYYPKLNNFTYNSKKITLSNKIYYRLLVGQFENKKQALQFCKRIDIKKKCLVRFIDK